MKALTILEPWASLIKVGAKKIETRSWATTYRGLLLIHAGASCKAWHMNLSWQEPFYSALKPLYFYHKDGEKPAISYDLGCIIAICQLVDCIKIKSSDAFSAELANGVIVNHPECVFGDYTPGRYAWILDQVKALEVPLPIRGKQRLWNAIEYKL